MQNNSLENTPRWQLETWLAAKRGISKEDPQITRLSRPGLISALGGGQGEEQSSPSTPAPTPTPVKLPVDRDALARLEGKFEDLLKNTRQDLTCAHDRIGVLVSKVRDLDDRYNTHLVTNDSRFEEIKQDMKALEKMVYEASQPSPLEIKISIQGKETTASLPSQHYAFKDLLTMVSAGLNVFMVGPAGSGKTTAAENVAKALGLPFFFNGAIDSEYKLTGFIDAQGRFVSKPFFEAFTKGGIYLADEVDASMPSAVMALNAALANGAMDFPSGCFKAHEDFRCIAAGNTFYGPDHHYVGRTKQDGAFLDRFQVLIWNYDPQLERHMALSIGHDHEESLQWLSYIREVREKTLACGIHTIISPRATVAGIKLLKAGMSWSKVQEVCVRKSMKEADWSKIAVDQVKEENKYKSNVAELIAKTQFIPSTPEPTQPTPKEGATFSEKLDFFLLYSMGHTFKALVVDELRSKGYKLKPSGERLLNEIWRECNRSSTGSRTLAISRTKGMMTSPKCVSSNLGLM